MDKTPKLYMVLLGCTPKGRLTEQHDIFFGAGHSLLSLKREIYAFWPDGGPLHIDSWREVTYVDGYRISIIPKEATPSSEEKLFFLNLGGYLPGEFEEYHYKALVVAKSMADAVKAAKRTAFYKRMRFKGAPSHIDEKYALDVDDMYSVEELFSEEWRGRYSIRIEKDECPEDELHIGYRKLNKR